MDETYEAWVHWVFDRPVTGPGQPAWYDKPTQDPWDPEADPERAVTYLSRLVWNPEVLIDRYGADQIGQGFWFLTDPSCSSHLLSFRSPTVDWTRRKHAIEGLFALYDRLFQQLCDPVLGHRERNDRIGGLVNRICYMFWDIAPLGPTGDGKHDHVCLETITRILALPHVACREGALHGFERWGRVDPSRANGAIDRLLALPSSAGEPELRAFAEQMRP